MMKRLAALSFFLLTLTAGTALAATLAEIQQELEQVVASSGGTIFPLGGPNTKNAAPFHR